MYIYKYNIWIIYRCGNQSVCLTSFTVTICTAPIILSYRCWRTYCYKRGTASPSPSPSLLTDVGPTHTSLAFLARELACRVDQCWITAMYGKYSIVMKKLTRKKRKERKKAKMKQWKTTCTK